ncbi:MAG: hypothetical protein ACP5VE_09965 [Chthonomonadales bacterium]
MESAWHDQRKWERRRVAWAVTLVVCASHAPWALLRALIPMVAYGAWFLHLLDVQMGGVRERRRVPFTAGWPLLCAATAAAVNALEPPLVLFVIGDVALFALAAVAWIEVRRI